jgi:hypothetical protein
MYLMYMYTVHEGKGKAVPTDVIKVHGGAVIKLHSFLTLLLWTKVVSFTLTSL